MGTERKGKDMNPKLSDDRLQEIINQCNVASHGGKTLGTTVTLPASQVQSLVLEVQSNRVVIKKQKKGAGK